LQIAVCAALRSAGIDHYDFRRAGDEGLGFRWSEVMSDGAVIVKDDGGHTLKCKADDYTKVLGLPRTLEAFGLDMGALTRADATILILPCNRSAHLELGYARGAGQRTAVMLDPDEEGFITPELMYLMVDYIAPSLFDLLGWLGVED
jgi:hypothetical protein